MVLLLCSLGQDGQGCTSAARQAWMPSQAKPRLAASAELRGCFDGGSCGVVLALAARRPVGPSSPHPHCPILCCPLYMLQVAIKKVVHVFDVATIAKRTLREIKLLKHFHAHDNIISLHSLLKPPQDPSPFNDVYMVMELLEGDLHRLGSGLGLGSLPSVPCVADPPPSLPSPPPPRPRSQDHSFGAAADRRACALLSLPDAARPQVHPLGQCPPPRHQAKQPAHQQRLHAQGGWVLAPGLQSCGTGTISSRVSPADLRLWHGSRHCQQPGRAQGRSVCRGRCPSAASRISSSYPAAHGFQYCRAS